MTWRLDFYSERRQALARYVVDAPTPMAALELGRGMLRTEHRPDAGSRTRSLFHRAQLLGGHEADGWVLYRIGQDG